MKKKSWIHVTLQCLLRFSKCFTNFDNQNNVFFSTLLFLLSRYSLQSASPYALLHLFTTLLNSCLLYLDNPHFLYIFHFISIPFSATLYFSLRLCAFLRISALSLYICISPDVHSSRCFSIFPSFLPYCIFASPNENIKEWQCISTPRKDRYYFFIHPP